MITHVNKSIRKFLQPVLVNLFESESFDSAGELTQIYETGVSVELALFPLGNRELKYLPEGQFTNQDLKVYEIGAGTLTDKSIINYNEKEYLVNGGTQRDLEGGFTSYLAKRKKYDTV